MGAGCEAIVMVNSSDRAWWRGVLDAISGLSPRSTCEALGNSYVNDTFHDTFQKAGASSDYYNKLKLKKQSPPLQVSPHHLDMVPSAHRHRTCDDWVARTYQKSPMDQSSARCSRSFSFRRPGDLEDVGRRGFASARAKAGGDQVSGSSAADWMGCRCCRAAIWIWAWLFGRAMDTEISRMPKREGLIWT